MNIEIAGLILLLVVFSCQVVLVVVFSCFTLFPIASLHCLLMY